MIGDQLTIEDWIASNPPSFGGGTYSDKHDKHRLESQYMKVFRLMSDAEWRSLGEIRAVVGGSEAGISARLRDFRKSENGGHLVEGRRRGNCSAGLFEYRLLTGNQ